MILLAWYALGWREAIIVGAAVIITLIGLGNRVANRLIAARRRRRGRRLAGIRNHR